MELGPKSMSLLERCFIREVSLLTEGVVCVDFIGASSSDKTHPLHMRGINSQSSSQCSSGIDVEPANLLT